jgi:hypothetical protein
MNFWFFYIKVRELSEAGSVFYLWGFSTGDKIKFCLQIIIQSIRKTLFLKKMRALLNNVQ